MSKPQRVVITGIGAVTPIGIGKESFWEGLATGKSGVSRIDDIVDLTDIPVKIGAYIREFDPLQFMDKKRARRLGRSSQLAIAATKLALEDGRLDLTQEDRDRIGVVIGTGIGNIEALT
ncbi:MAG: beta-ketoacyl synthase N-terminal-like domain-containing protein, partial [Candidatus Bipolaricaulia bacterium]